MRATMIRKRWSGYIGHLAAVVLIATAGILDIGAGQAEARVDAGSGGRPGNAAERAHRDFLDHGEDAAVLTAAHRGQWRAAPENSLPAVRAAYEDGAEIVEIDVQLTADGVPVLMHDTTVNRTTNGTGAVSDLTLAELRELRLREGLGGAQAALTGERVPTLAEAMGIAKNRGLVNLDKGWPAREEIFTVLRETGTVRNGLFKSDAPVAEVEKFRAAHRDAIYLHIVSDANIDDIDEFGAHQPAAYEVIFDSDHDAVARTPVLRRMAATGRVWINSMWNGLADHYTDEYSLVDPARGWGALIDVFGASVLQTDNVVALKAWLDTGRANPVPRGAVRVQGEDFARGGEGVAYHDTDAGNRGGVARVNEDVDVCDQDGAVDVCWLRATEWLTYEVNIPRSGTYRVVSRVSSPYSPAGTYRLSFDGGADSGPVAVRNTTSHSAFVAQDSGVERYLTRGTHKVRVSLDADAYQNWNLDWFQLERVGR
ncbi:glycerophosphodiester phosphodiesterase family protein [Streptomyces sp. NPDC057307]|uniref:glycerophosphodiester phosphodiesterase family protein n=1 Tax=Streptomyces sp. NPDC057307 TaxID=3346096 RepID=UPI0036450891